MRQPSNVTTLLHLFYQPMNKIFRFFFLSFLILNSQGAAPDENENKKVKQTAGIDQTMMINGHEASAYGMLVKLKPGYLNKKGMQLMMPMLKEQNLMVAQSYHSVPGLRYLSLPPIQKGGNPKAMKKEEMMAKIKLLQDSNLFDYVEPDWKVSTNQTPTDSAFVDGRLWGLRNTGQDGGTAGVDINVVEAWTRTTGRREVVIGVVDTGINYTHQDLAPQMWRNPGEIPGNGIDDDANGYIDDIFGVNVINGSGDPFDDNGHGSHVSGTAAASGLDSGDHVGVAYDVRLMGLKFLGRNGRGDTSDAILAIDYAVEAGADILNNSWGGGGFSQALNDSIQAANDAGILFVVAAGNNRTDINITPDFPSSYEIPNVISVAAINREGNISSFSNFGVTTVHLAAPGEEIFSCYIRSNRAYTFLEGTSMAAPHVSGVAALILSQFPDASIAELRNRLLNTARPLPALFGKTVSGGVVNATGALDLRADGDFDIAFPSSRALGINQSEDIFISLSDLTPITDATVNASFDGTTPVVFLDNGIAPDLFANDGIYSATLTTTSEDTTTILSGQATTSTGNTKTFTFDFPTIARPPNDDFANAIPLTDGTFITASNVGATREPSEPVNPPFASPQSLWWTWTAPQTEEVTISTSGSNLETTIAIYRENASGDLRLVTSDSGNFLIREDDRAMATFQARRRRVYYIQVSGEDSSSFLPAPETGDIVLHYPNPAVGATAPSISRQTHDRQVNITENDLLSVEANGTPPLSYQWFFDNEPIFGATDRELNLLNTDETDEGSYHVIVSNDLGEASIFPIFVSVDAVSLGPLNDSFTNSIILPGMSGTVRGSTEQATAEFGEPFPPGGESIINSIWYTFRASRSGQLNLDTRGSTLANINLTAYTGTEVRSLQELAGNESFDRDVSLTTLPVTLGQVVHIAVDAFEEETGEIILNYQLENDLLPPPNDDFNNRSEIASFGEIVIGSNLNATGETDEPNHDDQSGSQNSVWWSWTAPSSHPVTINTSDSNLNTALAVYTGSSIDRLTRVVGNESDSNLPTHTITFQALANTEYHIAVDGALNERGDIILSLETGISPRGRILLIDDQGGFGNVASLLRGEGFDVVEIINEFITDYRNLRNETLLATFDLIVYCERGDGEGSLLPFPVRQSLERYIQNGGDLLVTGHNALTSPIDINLVPLVRANFPAELSSPTPNWTTVAIDHPILNGPRGDFRNQTFNATGVGNDRFVPDLNAGTLALALINGQPESPRLIFNDLDGTGGSVGYWNGGLAGTTSVAQPDFNDVGNPQEIFLNYVNHVTLPKISPAGRALVYQDFNQISESLNALQNLNYETDLIVNAVDTLPADLSSYNVVMVQLGSTIPTPTEYAALTTFVTNGGSLILSFAGATVDPSLETALGVSTAGANGNNTSFAMARTSEEGRLFADLPFPISPNSTPQNTARINFQLREDTRGAAHYLSGSTAEEVAVAIGNQERTIVNGFALADYDPDDVVAMLESEIRYLTDPYAVWLRTQTANSTDDLSREGDPDGDGLNNLLEYALGLNPLAQNTGSVVRGEADGDSFFEVSFERPAGGATGVTYTLYQSPDLQTWSPITPSITPNGTGREILSARLIRQEAAFFQLKVSE